MNGHEAHNFKLFGTGWGGNFHFIANLTVEERFANWGRGGDESLLRVGLFGADQPVFHLDFPVYVKHYDTRAVPRAM